MTTKEHSRQELIEHATLTETDIQQIKQCRRSHNRLGFGYQIGFVRLENRFPVQQPFEIDNELLTYTSVQLGINTSEIHQYTSRQQTISEHQIRIRYYLNLKEFADADIEPVKQFIFAQSCRLEQTSALFSMVEQYLKEHNILQPVASTLQRIIGEQRRLAREYIYEKITSELRDETKQHLNLLLEVGENKFSALQQLKSVPQKPSPEALKSLTAKLEQIAPTGVLAVDLSWLNNNYQRLLANYVKRGNAHQLREVSPSHRWAAVTFFLWQTYQDTIDQILDMHDKLQNKITNWAKDDLNKEVWRKRKLIQDALAIFTLVGEVILDDNISDASLRETVFSNISKEELKTHIQQWKEWITMKKSHRFHYVVKRFSYIRQFSKDFLEHLEFSSPQGKDASLLNAISILKEMNSSGKRKLPDETPIAFIPRKLRPLVILDDAIDKHAWECALLTKIRDEVKSSNLSVTHSKRFGNFDDFFIPTNQWQEIQDSFFKESGLPSDPKDVAHYLTNRLNQAYDDFLSSQPNNTYANVNSDGWQLSTDPAEKLDPSSEMELDRLKSWLKKHMRQIKLPELLIEVDNELRFTHHFMPTASREERRVDEVCAIIATIMAHGSNVGPETMSKLIQAATYRQIQRITDWQLAEENQRSALAVVVNAIASLDTSRRWGEGKTEFILQYMSQPPLRRRVRRGILKVEQLHSLAREVAYGKQGTITERDFSDVMKTCSCLTLIMACIIYWQSKEIQRCISECKPQAEGIDISLIEHVSPIEWKNVVLYGEYVIDPNLIR